MGSAASCVLSPCRKTSKRLLHLLQEIEGSGDCVIENASMRGITLLQLDKLLMYAEFCCSTSKWRKKGSGRDCADKGKVWKPEKLDLYALVEFVIKPVTQLRECSYVEFASHYEVSQIPRWFVSHWWGERVRRFIECLRAFHDARALESNTPFWICAYALNQHRLDKEIGTENPLHEPFAKAIANVSVEGTVAIIDEHLVTYRRAWCCFESALTIEIEKQLDLIISTSIGICMVQDTPTLKDLECPLSKLPIPHEALIGGLSIAIETSDTTCVGDRKRILNCITTQSTSSTVEPPIYHPQYDRYNEYLRNKFAESFLRMATACGDVHGVRIVLRFSPSAKLSWPDAGTSNRLSIVKGLAGKHSDEPVRQDIVALFEQAAKYDPCLHLSRSAGWLGESQSNPGTPLGPSRAGSPDSMRSTPTSVLSSYAASIGRRTPGRSSERRLMRNISRTTGSFMSARSFEIDDDGSPSRRSSRRSSTRSQSWDAITPSPSKKSCMLKRSSTVARENITSCEGIWVSSGDSKAMSHSEGSITLTPIVPLTSFMSNDDLDLDLEQGVPFTRFPTIYSTNLENTNSVVPGVVS